jgi:hypothetical protein
MTTRLKVTADPNLWTQIGLDSGSLTMLGTIAHQLGEPGEYRGTVHHGADVKAVFFVTADSKSPAAQVAIDLAALEGAQSGEPAAGAPGDSCCIRDAKQSSGGQRYTVNPRGYVLFHVQSGQGGYYVHLRRIDTPETDKGYDTRTLKPGDAFTAMILRPGTYAIRNTLARGSTEAVVRYPTIRDKPYVPPAPVRIECTAAGFDTTGRIDLGVGQGLLFHARADTRIAITLERPDDGPARPNRGRTGFHKLQLT